MTSTTATGADEAARIVSTYFGQVIDQLRRGGEAIIAPIVAARREGPLTSAALDEIIEPSARLALGSEWFEAYGAGFVSEPGLLSDTSHHLAWWQGADRRKLVLATQNMGKEFIDYSEREWYRLPRRTGDPHVAGPYVDYLCSDEYVVTAAVPVYIGAEFAGVSALDILAETIETQLLPALDALGSQITLVNGVHRVLLSTDPLCSAGESLRGSVLLSSSHRRECAPFPLTVLASA